MILKSTSRGSVSSLLRGVSLLPSTGEWVYSTTPATYEPSFEEPFTENSQWDGGVSGKTNMVRSMDNLKERLPKCEWVSLIVSWFGSDLRLGECEIEPKGEHYIFEEPGGQGGTYDLSAELGAWGVSNTDGTTIATLYDVDASAIIFKNRIEDGGTSARVQYNWSVTGASDTSISIEVQPCSDSDGNNPIGSPETVSVSNSGASSGTLDTGLFVLASETESIVVSATRSTDGSWNDNDADRTLIFEVVPSTPDLQPDVGASAPYPYIVNGLTRADMGIPSLIYDAPAEYNPVFVQFMLGRNGATVTQNYDTTVDPDNTVGQPYDDPDNPVFVDQSAGAVLCEYAGGVNQEAYSPWNHAETSGGRPGGNIPYGKYRWRGFVWSPVERDFSPAVRKGGPGNDFLLDPEVKRIPAKQWTEIILDFAADGTFSYAEIIIDKNDNPAEWFMVTNVTIFELGTAEVAYGGTPSDRSVLEGIAEIKARGYKCLFYPFILMDIDEAQKLPDPDGIGTQGAYPWRGRISPLLADQGTSQVSSDVEAFFGSCSRDDFEPDFVNATVNYTGPTEFGLRRMILHYAHLCAMAGNVDSFCIATEMRGLTTARDGVNSWPAVDKLLELARDCRVILGDDVEITYACDWSEFMPRNYTVGSDFYSIFHLDPLWADDAIDYIGIDNYLPLSDWRGTPLAIDDAIWGSIYNLSYLKSQVEGGERYDYEYLNEFDRDNQVRTPITEWRYRDKAHKDWWLNSHYNIIAGVEQSSPTAWAPKSKRFAYTEFGCAAIDKGTNQPNKFLDPKSVESITPYYSTGARDDRMQQVYYQAMMEYWEPAAGSNPTNDAGEHFLDTSMFIAWTWDARPWPAFPKLSEVWSDGENYNAGHWLQGRSWIERP